MEIKKEIVHFTHNDPDALGCMLNLEFATPDIKKKTFFTNYQNIEQQASDIIYYIENNYVSVLVISDISFSQHKHLLLDFSEICKKNNIIIVFADHHIYPKDFFNDFDELGIIYKHDITKSATLIMQDMFKTKDKNKNLDLLSEIINSFDIWLMDSTYFKIGIIFTWYFYRYISKSSIEELAYVIKQNNYKLPKNFNSEYQLYFELANKHIDNLKKNNLLVSDGFCTLAFTDDFYNEILYREFTKTPIIPVVLIINSYGIIRIRFNEKYEDASKVKIKEQILGKSEIGHLNAFSIKVENNNFNNIMNKIEDLTKIFQPYKVKFKNQ